MTMKQNIYASATPPDTGEIFETLCTCGTVLIERIVSSDILPDTEYDQDHDEWVVLLEGNALLSVGGETVRLVRGDYLFLPAHTVHRVLETSNGAVWLAVHIGVKEPAVSEETSG